MINNLKKFPTEWEKILTYHIANKRYSLCRIYKTLAIQQFKKNLKWATQAGARDQW